MPADALPQPWPQPTTGLVRLERTYRDVLGRPLRGTVRITGAQRTADGATVTVGAPVNATVTDGLLAVNLPAGTYEIVAALTTVDGERARENDTITLT